MPGIIHRAVRRLREAQVADSGGPGIPDPGGSAEAMSKGLLGALAPTEMAALPCCSATRTTASPAPGRAAVQPGDLLYPIGACEEVLHVLGRMHVQQIIPVGEDQALLRETLAQHGPWRSWPRPAPSRPSPASRGPISRSTGRRRRDLAAPDLPAEAGLPGPSRQRRRPPPSTRPASRASTGWPNPPQQICKLSWPDRPSRFPITRHASPRPHP